MSKPARMRTSTWENIIFVIAAAIALMVAVIMDKKGMPQKWHAAIVGDILPFAVVIMNFRRWWSRGVFWAFLGMGFVAHTAAIWATFQYALAFTQILGIIVWVPIAFLDTLVLYVVVKKVVERFTVKAGGAEVER